MFEPIQIYLPNNDSKMIDNSCEASFEMDFSPYLLWRLITDGNFT